MKRLVETQEGTSEFPTKIPVRSGIGKGPMLFKSEGNVFPTKQQILNVRLAPLV